MASDERKQRDRLYRAKQEGDAAYLIEALRLDPDGASLAAGWLADMQRHDAIPTLVQLLDAASPAPV